MNNNNDIKELKILTTICIIAILVITVCMIVNINHTAGIIAQITK